MKMGITSHRMTSFDPERSKEGLRNNFDLLEEKRDEAVLRVAAYKQKMAKYYNSRVKTRRFAVGDLILRKVTQATQDPIEGKLR